MARTNTPARILEAARRLFNARGYASTKLTEIAAEIGISQGNLTYHFPTKRDLVTAIQEQVGAQIATRRATLVRGDIAEDYVGRLMFVTDLNATFRFLLRDDAAIGEGPNHQRPHRVLVDDYNALRDLLKRVQKEGLFRSSPSVDLDMLTRSLWILSRYWMDHLAEMELIEEITPSDQIRGVEHHLTVLHPTLKASGRRRFERALATAKSFAEQRVRGEPAKP